MPRCPCAPKNPSRAYAKNWILITFDTTLSEVYETVNESGHFALLIEGPRPYRGGTQLYQVYFNDWQKRADLYRIKAEYEWDPTTYWNRWNPDCQFYIYRDVVQRQKQIYENTRQRVNYVKSYPQDFTDDELDSIMQQYEEELLMLEMLDKYERKQKACEEAMRKVDEDDAMASWARASNVFL